MWIAITLWKTTTAQPNLSGEVAKRAGVKKLYPVHHSRRYNMEIEELLAECYAAFGEPKS